MNFPLFSLARDHTHSLFQVVKQRLRQWTKPGNHTLVLNAASDLTRNKPELILENMLLRQQLIVLQRKAKRPALTWRDRTLFVLLASKLPHWKEALVIVQPDTVLRWHRDLFHWVWRRKSRHMRRCGRQPLVDDIVALIKRMARDNRTWGAERIRGELQTFDLFFRSLFVFVIIELGSWRLVHFGVTRYPIDAWVAKQLREATPFGEGPRHLIRDNDRKYGRLFARLASGTEIEVLRTPCGAPKANAICERFLGSVRRECLDHFLMLSERHLHRVMKEYQEYFNCARPHQGIGQTIPCQSVPVAEPGKGGELISHPVLGGLRHDYQWRAAERSAYARTA